MAQRWRWPLVGLAVVVAVAILAAAVLLIRRPHAAATTAIDACVAGTWHVTKYAEQLTVAGIGPVTFRGTDPGATLRLGRDGKGLVDYGAGTTFTSAVAVAGQQVGIKLVLAGTVTYDFRTNGGIISFTRVAATGTTTTTTTTGRSQSEALKGSTDPAQYACEGDGLTTYTAAYRAEMRRG